MFNVFTRSTINNVTVPMVEYSVVLGDSTPLAVEPFDLRELFNDKSKSTPYGRGHRLTGYAC
jgi:hypothetical protein